MFVARPIVQRPTFSATICPICVIPLRDTTRPVRLLSGGLPFQNLRALHRIGVVTGGVHGVMLTQKLELRGAGIGHMDAGRGETLVQQTAYETVRHVAAADERNARIAGHTRILNREG